jgi:hypothetical protein
MVDRQLIFGDFEHRVGSIFTLSDPAVALGLEEATLLSARFGMPDLRPPFSLIFVGPGDMILPQRLYQLTHEEMGEVTIFLVPIGKEDRGVLYQAIFN